MEEKFPNLEREIERYMDEHPDDPKKFLPVFDTDDRKPGPTGLPRFLEKQCEELQSSILNLAYKPPKKFYFNLASFLYKETPRIIMLNPHTVINLAGQLFKTQLWTGPILIHGERGTGKELIANRIHKMGSRKDRPFRPLDCGALSDDLAESELFGHEKGAFTGASSKKIGILKEADGGVVFLDEIAKLSRKIQGKLMRALQEKKIRPVGSNQYIPIDVQIYSATNEKLDGSSDFLPDLYDRLNGLPIQMPVVFSRECGKLVLTNEDLRALATHFILEQMEEIRLQKRDENGNVPDKLTLTLQPEQFSDLWQTPYDGNIRQMETHCKRAVVEAVVNKTNEKDFYYSRQEFYDQLTPGTMENIKFKTYLGNEIHRWAKERGDQEDFDANVVFRLWAAAKSKMESSPKSDDLKLLDANSAYLACMNAETYRDFQEARKRLDNDALADWLKIQDFKCAGWMEQKKAEKVGLDKHRWSALKKKAGLSR